MPAALRKQLCARNPRQRKSPAGAGPGAYILHTINLAEGQLTGLNYFPCAPNVSDKDRLNAVLEFMYAHLTLRLDEPQKMILKVYSGQFCPKHRLQWLAPLY